MTQLLPSARKQTTKTGMPKSRNAVVIKDRLIVKLTQVVGCLLEGGKTEHKHMLT